VSATVKSAATGEAREAPACAECDGTGMVWTDGCTCGTGPQGYYGMHERYCGAEPCPAGCAFSPGAVSSG
jgi:hypothetical protein